MIFSACSIHKLSPGKYYSYGDLRIRKTDNNVRLFSFYIDDAFVEADKSRQNKEHTELTKNQTLLLNKHLQRKEYCLDKKNKPKFVITEKQNPVYQEIHVADKSEVKFISIAPLGVFGKCVDDNVENQGF